MKKLIAMILFLCLSVVILANVAERPPGNDVQIEMSIENDVVFVAIESPVVNPIIFEGVAISTGGILAISYKNIIEKIKCQVVDIPNICDEINANGTNILTATRFDYSFNKLLKQSWQYNSDSQLNLEAYSANLRGLKRGWDVEFSTPAC